MSTMSQLGKYQPYPEYKDSGVEWLGKVPVDWQIKRLKYLAPLVTSKATNRTNPIGLENIESWTGRVICTDSEFQGEGTGFIPGDILFGKLRPYLAKVMLAKLAGEAVGDFHVLRPKNGIVSQYLQYQMLTREFISIVDGSTFGAKMPRASWDFMADLYCAQPREAEASTIAAFLDYETARIDQLIAKQQQLIELLKEKRQAVISHAVTKGLDPNAPMKDSGVEWLGQVPEHWVVTKLSRLVFMQEGPGLRTWQFTDEGTRVICVTNITESGIDFSRLQKYISTEEYMSSYRHFKVKQGDILISSSGNSWGKVAEYHGNDEVILNTSTIRVNVLSGNPLVRGFIKLYLQSVACREQLGLAMTGACQPNFGPSHLKEVFSPVPPQNEQNEIVRYITDATSTFARTIGVCEATVALLQERRTAVISAAVTGKIDLRGWQPPKREEAA